MRRFIFPFLFLSFFVACSSRHESNGEYSKEAVGLDLSTDDEKLAKAPFMSSKLAEEANADAQAGDVQNPTTDASQKIASQIIQNATIRFQVEDLGKSTSAIQQAVKNNKGYINSSNETRSNSEIASSITIRVPFSQFEPLLEEVLKQSIFLNTKNITSEDVTEQFVDIQARVKAKKVAEQRYLDILRQAKTVKDVLEVESQLRQIREEVEAQEGRLQYLKDQVQFSTINLEVYQQTTYQPEPEPGFFRQLFTSLREGGSNFLEFLIVLVKVWPFFIAGGFGVYFFSRWKKRRNAKRDPVNH